MISLDLMTSSEVRKAGNWSKCTNGQGASFDENGKSSLLLNWATASWISSLFGWTENSRSWSPFLNWQFFVLQSLIRATYPIVKGHIRLTQILKSLLNLCLYSVATKRKPISVLKVAKSQWILFLMGLGAQVNQREGANFNQSKHVFFSKVVCFSIFKF